MITLEQKQKLLAALKSHTVSSIRENQKHKIPILITGEETTVVSIDPVDPVDDYYAIIPKNGNIPRSTEQQYALDTLEELAINNIIWDGILLNDQERQNTWKRIAPDGVAVSSKNSRVTYGIKKINFINQRFFHYNDTWYTYKYSVDEPQYNFGIVRVDNLPLNSFEGRREMRSFVATMHDLIYQRYCEPFMFFVNRKFVNWENIVVVFDCDDIYLLLYGDEYNYFNLEDAEFHMVVLPFAVDYIGNESDSHFDMMYEVTKSYIQDSLYITDSGDVKIIIPGIDEMYEYRAMVYNVGAWLYTQLKYHKLGLLSQDRIEKLRRFNIVKREYDLAGNIINTYATKFNALDRDSYNTKLLNSICGNSISDFISKAIFRFDSNGLLADNGSSIIALNTDEIYFVKYNSSDAHIIQQIDKNINNILFRENYLTWKNKLLNPETEIETCLSNIFKVDNPEEDEHDIYIFVHKRTEKVVSNMDTFNMDFIVEQALKLCALMVKNEGTRRSGVDAHVFQNNKLKQIIKRVNFEESDEEFLFIPTMTDLVVFLNADDDEREEYFKMFLEYLDYIYTDDNLYDENYNNALETVIKYNPLLFNNLYHTNIVSSCYSGLEANEQLLLPWSNDESRKGLKIARDSLPKHESYVLVFENGELIEEYSNMIVYANFFFIPMEREFDDNAIIELLYFNEINNNEINFKLTSEMLGNDDSNYTLLNRSFEEYIDIGTEKIFCDYPSDIMIYPSIVKPSAGIAFNISNNISKHLSILSQVANDYISDPENNDYTFTAVSSRKFIYQRLYPKNRSYKLLMDKRFRYCDDPTRYMLFINGRRMNEDSFLITIPKYSRPFYAMYLYTAKFVYPTDRVELFYLPEPLPNINMDNHVKLDKNGYITETKSNLDVPYDPRYYMFFMNGKKIPSSALTTVNTYTLRCNFDPASTNDFIINNIYTDTIPEIVEYMKSDTYSTYDNIISTIRNSGLGVGEIDKLIGKFIKMSNTEPNLTRTNVGRIAILNEVIRDFWVTTGYSYNDGPFVYDYETEGFFDNLLMYKYDPNADDLIIKDSKGNIVLPSMDATADQYLNIIRNDTHLLYFYHDPSDNWYGSGTTLSNGIKFYWEYSINFYNDNNITSQTVTYSIDNDTITEVININDREWSYSGPINEDTKFTFQFIAGNNIINKTTEIKFASGVYYGIADEDQLQHYSRDPRYSWQDGYTSGYMALIPFTGIIPTPTSLIEEVPVLTANTFRSNYEVIEKLAFKSIKIIDDELTLFDDGSKVDPSAFDFINENIDNENHEITYDEDTGLTNYFIASDLEYLLNSLNCVYQPTPELELNDFIIGNNNYFIFACPRDYAFDENNNILIKFKGPDLNDPDLIANFNDGKSVPYFTSGEYSYNSNNKLEALDEFEIKFLDEFTYTDKNGTTNDYCVFKSNGFFTRNMDNFKIDISISYKDRSMSLNSDINDNLNM